MYTKSKQIYFKRRQVQWLAFHHYEQIPDGKQRRGGRLWFGSSCEGVGPIMGGKMGRGVRKLATWIVGEPRERDGC